MIKMKKKKNLRSQHCTYWATGGAAGKWQTEPNPRKRSNKNWNLTALSEGRESKLKVLSLSYIGYCVMFFFFFFWDFVGLEPSGTSVSTSTNAFDCLQGEQVPLGSSPTESKKGLVGLTAGSAIAFLYLLRILFRSLLRLRTCFLSFSNRLCVM